MMLKQKIFLVAAAVIALSGCKQELPKSVSKEPAFGTITATKMTDNQKQLIYTEGQDPYKQNWGTAALYSVTVDGKEFVLHWDQAEKFKGLKSGDKVNLHPTEYISCVGEADLKPVCSRLMRIYKSDRRVNPLEMAK